MNGGRDVDYVGARGDDDQQMENAGGEVGNILKGYSSDKACLTYIFSINKTEQECVISDCDFKWIEFVGNHFS